MYIAMFIIVGILIFPIITSLYFFVDFDSKKQNDNKHFGGGNGAGMTVSPIAFLVVRDSGVEILNVNKENTTNAVDSIADLITKAPDLFNKVKDSFKKNKEEKEETQE